MSKSEFEYRSDDELHMQYVSHDPDKTPVMGVPIIDVDSLYDYDYAPSFIDWARSALQRARDRWKSTEKVRWTLGGIGLSAIVVASALAAKAITGSSEHEPPAPEDGAAPIVPTGPLPGVPVEDPAEIMFKVVSEGFDGRTIGTYQCALVVTVSNEALSHDSGVEHFLAYNPGYVPEDHMSIRAQRAAELLNGFSDNFGHYEQEYGLSISQVPVLHGDFPNVSYEEPVYDIRNCRLIG